MLNNQTSLSIEELHIDNHTLLLLEEFSGLASEHWFDPSYWQQKQAVVGTSKGRYTTYFIETLNQHNDKVEMVLRHYYRGGFVRHFNKDKFWCGSVSKCRASREFFLLSELWSKGLPVPRPLLCMMTDHGFGRFSNDILIERIANAKDAYNLLLNKEIKSNVWKCIGSTIRQFHDLNVFHADLNIHNILIANQQDVYLIDFDRCEFRADSPIWKQKNLDRLLRSLHKEQANNPTFYFSMDDWHNLLVGYGK